MTCYENSYMEKREVEVGGKGEERAAREVASRENESREESRLQRSVRGEEGRRKAWEEEEEEVVEVVEEEVAW